MRERNWVMGCVDFRPFFRVEKVGHKAKNTLLVLDGDHAATRARCGTHAFFSRAWKK